MKKPSVWTHHKFGKKTFRGTYTRDANNERAFVLKCNEITRRITFESHEAAKGLGWRKKA